MTDPVIERRVAQKTGNRKLAEVPLGDRSGKRKDIMAFLSKDGSKRWNEKKEIEESGDPN